ncbi:hypothetical protein Tco_1354590 [Tanacetum coccineum]
MVGNCAILNESIIVTTGKKRWSDLYRIKLVPGNGSTAVNSECFEKINETLDSNSPGSSIVYQLETRSDNMRTANRSTNDPEGFSNQSWLIDQSHIRPLTALLLTVLCRLFKMYINCSLRTSLDDITKNIRMAYLPKRRWSTLEKKRAHIMIKAIGKQLKERRLTRSLEKFVGGRHYGTDLRLLQRTI